MKEFLESPIFWMVVWCLGGLIVGNWFGSMARSGDFYEDTRIKTRITEALERMEKTSRLDFERRLENDKELQEILKIGREYFLQAMNLQELGERRAELFAKQAADRFDKMTHLMDASVTGPSVAASPIEDMLCPQCRSLVEADGVCSECKYNTGSPRVLDKAK